MQPGLAGNAQRHVRSKFGLRPPKLKEASGLRMLPRSAWRPVVPDTAGVTARVPQLGRGDKDVSRSQTVAHSARTLRGKICLSPRIRFIRLSLREIPEGPSSDVKLDA